MTEYIKHTAHPQNGRIEVSYSTDDADEAAIFLRKYIDKDDSTYQDAQAEGKPFRCGVPESVFEAAIVFKKAAALLHFYPGAGVEWLIGSSPNIDVEDIRDYAVQNLRMERTEDTLAQARARVKSRRAAAGQLGKDAQLEQAMTGATTDEVINALFGHFDGDDMVHIIGGLTAMMDHLSGLATEKAA